MKLTDPRALNADLHAHSNRSDGALSPAQLVGRAHAQGVQLLALTDHDELDGLAQARDACRTLGLGFVAGVEVSASWAGHTLHVLGLGIDPETPALQTGLAGLRRLRLERAREIAHRLERVGFAQAWSTVLSMAPNPALITRTHFAQAMVQSGHCADYDEAFSRFLGQGRPGDVPQRWAGLAEAVGWIRDAGGVAVLAHPGRYRLADAAQWTMLSQFRACGGGALELVTGAHSREQVQRFAGAARHFGFSASRGSDFHGVQPGFTELGALAPLPEGIEPVWACWTGQDAPVIG